MSPVTKKVLSGIWNGFFHRCPACHQRTIYKSYLKVMDKCSHCGIALSHYPSDDMPPYIAMFLISAVVVPLTFVGNSIWEIPIYLQLLIWIPVTVLLILLALPSIKGSIIGILWALDIRHDENSSK